MIFIAWGDNTIDLVVSSLIYGNKLYSLGNAIDFINKYLPRFEVNLKN